MTEERNPIVEAVITDGVLTHIVTENNEHEQIKSPLGFEPGSYIDLQSSDSQSVADDGVFDLGEIHAEYDPRGYFSYDAETRKLHVQKGLYGVYWEVDSEATPGLTTSGFYLGPAFTGVPWTSLANGVSGHTVTQAEAQAGGAYWWGNFIISAGDTADISIARSGNPSSIPANFNYTQLKVVRIA